MLETTITPRIAETDGAGHINNTVLPVWFEAGRFELFRILTPSLSFAEWRATVARLEVDFHAQIYIGEDVRICTWIERVGTKSFTVTEELWQGGRHCASGKAVYVYFNIAMQRSEPVPPEVRAAFEAHRRPVSQPDTKPDTRPHTKPDTKPHTGPDTPAA